MSRSRRRRSHAQRQKAAAGTSSQNTAQPEMQEQPAMPAGPQPIVIHQRELHGSSDFVPVEPALGAMLAAQVEAAAARAESTASPQHDVASIGNADAPVRSGMKRADSLDALRGLFLIAMTLGFTIQTGMFPDWMYHLQTPVGPVVDRAGISWRDIAYGAFLFTMAAAMPITNTRRIDRGDTEMSIVGAALQRGFMLFFFALLIGHTNTYFTGYTQVGRYIAIAGFALMFALFVRRRSDWDETRFNVMRRTAWIATIAFLALTPLLYDATFSITRRDGVMATLAFAAVAGAIIWYLTRENLVARLIALAGVVALYLGARTEGWIEDWWWNDMIPGMYSPSVLGVLAIIIPGTIAGDHVLRWMKAPEPDEPDVKRWSTGRIALLALIAVAFVPIVVVGMYNRWVLETTQLSLALCIGGAVVAARATYPGERLLKSLFTTGAILLIVGLLLDPFENGIRKVPDTLSYFFTISGLTTMLLVALSATVDLLRRRTLVQPLIEVGQNPMLAYVVFTVFLNSIFESIPALQGVLRGSPGESILRSLLTVALVVGIVRFFTQRRIFWRT